MKKIILFLILLQISFFGFAQNEKPITIKIAEGLTLIMNIENGSTKYEISKQNLDKNGLQLEFSDAEKGKMKFTSNIFCLAKDRDPFIFNFGHYKNNNTNKLEYRGTENYKFNVGDTIYLEDILVFNEEKTFQTKGQALVINVVE